MSELQQHRPQLFRLVRPDASLRVGRDAWREDLLHLARDSAGFGLCGARLSEARRSAFWWGVETAATERFCLACNAEAELAARCRGASDEACSSPA